MGVKGREVWRRGEGSGGRVPPCPPLIQLKYYHNWNTHQQCGPLIQQQILLNYEASQVSQLGYP